MIYYQNSIKRASGYFTPTLPREKKVHAPCLGPGGIASAGKPYAIGLLPNPHHTVKEFHLACVFSSHPFPK
jgi:hypothetical protein